MLVVELVDRGGIVGGMGAGGCVVGKERGGEGVLGEGGQVGHCGKGQGGRGGEGRDGRNGGERGVGKVCVNSGVWKEGIRSLTGRE